MTPSRTLDVGMDVHQESMAVADGAAAHPAEVLDLGFLGTRQGDIDRRIRTRPSKSPHLGLVDAAGPCGSWLDRDLPTQGDSCWGVVPSLLPKQAGERVNTTSRGAIARWPRLASQPFSDVTIFARPAAPRGAQPTGDCGYA